MLALALVSALAYGFWRASRPAPDFFQGQMEALETDVAPKITARIAEVLVREGDRVQPGTPLLRLDSPEVQAKLAQATAAEQAAQAVASKAAHGARPQEIEMARLNWQRAQAAADLAEKSFHRVEGLARDGLIATQKRDEAEANHKAARDLALAARAQYDMARAGARDEDKAAAAAQARQVAGVVAEVQAAQAETRLPSPVAGERGPASCPRKAWPSSPWSTSATNGWCSMCARTSWRALPSAASSTPRYRRCRTVPCASRSTRPACCRTSPPGAPRGRGRASTCAPSRSGPGRRPPSMAPAPA